MRSDPFQELAVELYRKVCEAEEEVYRVAWELTAPEYRDRLVTIVGGPRSTTSWTQGKLEVEVEIPCLASWAFEGVARCTRGDWPDCGAIPCGFPCAGQKID